MWSDMAAAYARESSSGLMRRVGASGDALAARVSAELAARG